MYCMLVIPSFCKHLSSCCTVKTIIFLVLTAVMGPVQEQDEDILLNVCLLKLFLTLVLCVRQRSGVHRQGHSLAREGEGLCT